MVDDETGLPVNIEVFVVDVVMLFEGGIGELVLG